MALSALSKSIYSKAEQEQQRLEKAYEREIAEMDRSYEVRVARFKEEVDSHYQREIATKKQNILGKYKTLAKQETLQAKSEVLETCYRDVLETLRSLKGEERQKLFSAFVQRAQQVMNFDEVYCTRSDARWVKPLVGEQVTVRRDDTQDGLYFVGNEGREVLDMNFEPVLRECYEQVSDTLQEQLFQEK